MTKFFFKFEKPIFCPFPQFLGQKKFFKKIGFSCTTHKGFWHPGKTQRNLMSNSIKTLRQMLGGKDGQTLFHRIIPATTRGLTSTTAVDWNLKVKNKKCNVGLIKYYCITVSMQKISSIQLIQHILGSHELNDHAHF